MSTALRLKITSLELSNTLKIAELIGKNLRGGEVVELNSDLGGGKTVFVKGLAMGAGSKDIVSSPTFTISKIYKCPKFNISHYDFYRLNDAGLVAEELKESIDGQTVTAIEWSNVVKNVLPKNHLVINIEQLDENKRNVSLECPSNLSYLLNGLI